MAEFYKNWYNVQLDPNTEVLPLIGSKEGIMHICMTYLNEGDKVLIPTPAILLIAALLSLPAENVLSTT
jgi:aspartate/methionine/tyrosine aminotransferase